MTDFKYPRLKFKIDQKKDAQTFFAFNNEGDFSDGRDLEWAILRKYPEFKKYKKDSIKIEDLIESIIKESKFLYNQEGLI